MAIVQSRMSFLEPWISKEEEPYIRGKTDESFPRTNFVNQEYDVEIRDARSNKNEFALDTHGFCFHEDEGIASEVIDAIRAKNKAYVEEKYYPQITKLVEEITGATKVIIFDYTYRRRDPSLAPNENPNGREQPATLVHCDQSAIGATGRVKRHGGGEAEMLLKMRGQIINVWRPIHGVVEDWPLAVMDFRSMKQSEIHPTSIFREKHEMQGQTVSINFGPDQKWYYLNRQRPQETTLIKIWDSKENVARMCAHCAFPDPDAPSDARPRESIEVRCLVFHDGS